MYSKYLKRILDLIISIIGLLIISPLLLVLILILYISNDGKPFFYQKRPGLKGSIFKVIKLKTMNDKKDIYGEFLPYEDRVTKTGLFLRKYSLDEIPQLLNVVKGDMSIIGPRPLLPEYLPLYSDFQKRRHELKPGVTGWAQVNGRNAISWDKKFELDVWYVDNISFYLDLKILIKTIKKVILKDGVNSSENMNMPAFKGND
tara:strand:- start:14995 stop:15600 length:606 start_codon:yes stop_codon:yes gene_type:complete